MLTDAQLAVYSRDGVLTVEDVFDPTPLHAEYAQVLDRLYECWFARGLVKEPPDDLNFESKLRAAYRAGCDWFQPMDCSLPGGDIAPDTPFHFGPALFELIRTPRLLDIIEQVIGSEIVSNPIQHIRIKPPTPDLHADEIRPHVAATDWHQDRAVAHEEADATEMVTVWCAVTDATIENGCLQAMPRPDEMLPHCPKVQTAIADGFLDPAAARSLPVKAGGIVLLHPLTPHASLDNRTNGFRWSFDIRYNRVGHPTGRSHFPSFVARSRSAPETELQDWRIWREMWEQARLRLAGAPRIPLHRWTHDAPHCA